MTLLAHPAAPMLWLLPVLPLVAGTVLARLHDRRTLLPVAVLALLATLALGSWAAAAQPVAAWSMFGPRLSPGIAAVGFGRVMVVLVPAIALPVVVYAAAERHADSGLPRLLALLVAFTGAMQLLVLATDFLTLLLAWELVGACSWALIACDWRDAARPRAARDAFLTTRAGDLGLYLAAAAAFHATGSLEFAGLDSLDGVALHVVAAGVLLAAAAKSAQLPFSPWLFSAMAGPTAASALLHSATMVAAGAYLLARLAPALARAEWLAPTVGALGLATALAGGLVASVQHDLKKALAASTSAQYGLMLVAIGAGFPVAAGFHLVTHAAFKALLFLGAGIALHTAGTLGLARLRLGSALPRIALLFGVGVLALAGVPPLGAAWSKEAIVRAAAAARDGTPWLVAGVLAAGWLSAFYASRLQLLAFAPGRNARAARPERGAVLAVAFLALLSLALGVLWLPAVADSLARALGAALPPSRSWPLAASVLTVISAGLLCWLAWRRKALLDLGLPLAVHRFVAGWWALPQLAHAAVVTPARALSHALAAFDDRVVDAGIRLAVRGSDRLSRMFGGIGERGVQGLVGWFARMTELLAGLSTRIDVRRVDALVERVAQGIGLLGTRSRRLQTGLVHDYYRLAAIGVLAMTAASAIVTMLMRR